MAAKATYRALRAIVEMLQTPPATAAAKARASCWTPATACNLPCWCSTGPAARCWSGAPDRKAAAGARKIIASYVLTASLSYALCPSGQPPGVWHHRAGRSVFQKLAGRGSAHHPGAARVWPARAVRHPNKEVRLLRNHTRSAVVVHRRGAHRPRWHRCAGRRLTHFAAARKAPPPAMRHEVAQVLAAKLAPAMEQRRLAWKRQLLGGGTAWPLTPSIGQPDTAVFERRRRAAQPFAASGGR